MSDRSVDIQQLIADAIEDSHDGTLDDKRLEEIRQLLLTSPEARQTYLRHNQLSQMLGSDTSTSHQIETTKPVQAKSFQSTWLRMIVVASLLITVLGSIYFINIKENNSLPNNTVAIQSAIRPASSDATVAVLTESIAASWKHDQLEGASAVPLRAGWLNLNKGSAVIRFNCGAMVTLSGPARFRLLNDKHAYLESGKLVASVADKTIGFRIDSPTMQLTDLGTEFGVDASANGATEVHVLKGLVEVTQKNTKNKIKLHKNEARKFTKENSPESVSFRKEMADKLIANRPSQRIGIYTFNTSGSGHKQDPYVTNSSANVLAGGEIQFHDFTFHGVVPAPTEQTKNLNRWSFKSWRPNYRVNDFYVGFKVEVQKKQVLQLNQLSLELFRAGGAKNIKQAPQDGVLRVSSDGFATFTRFILMNKDSFVNQAKFITVDLSKMPPASHYEFRFLFKGPTKARAIRLDEVTLDTDIIHAKKDDSN